MIVVAGGTGTPGQRLVPGWSSEASACGSSPFTSPAHREREFPWQTKAAWNCSKILSPKRSCAQLTRRGWPTPGWMDRPESYLSGFTGLVLKALAADPRVALTIDDNAWPYKVMLVRGRSSVDLLDDVSPEYELAATRYFGPEQGPAWVSTLRGKTMARIAIMPEWVGILDFQARFPSALG